MALQNWSYELCCNPGPSERLTVNLIRTIVTFLVCKAIIASISAFTSGTITFSYWAVTAIEVNVIIIEAVMARVNFR